MTPLSDSAEIYLVRHGQTDWNLEDRMQGHTDIALNDTGISQAIHLGETLKDVPFVKAFSSDLSRAYKTAELILTQREIPIVVSSHLRERSAGALEGKTNEQIDLNTQSFFLSDQALDKDAYMKTAWHPELETLHSIFERVSKFIFEIAQDLSSHHPILIVSHGAVVRSILDYFSFTPRSRWVITNCGFIKLSIKNNSIRITETHGVSQKHMMKQINL